MKRSIQRPTTRTRTAPVETHDLSETPRSVRVVRRPPPEDNAVPSETHAVRRPPRAKEDRGLGKPNAIDIARDRVKRRPGKPVTQADHARVSEAGERARTAGARRQARFENERTTVDDEDEPALPRCGGKEPRGNPRRRSQQITASFVFERDTKGAVVFAEVDDNGAVLEIADAAVGKLYVRKSQLGGVVPKFLTITIDFTM